jgi:hypothetical protein
MNDDIKKYEEQKLKKTNPKEYKKLKEKERNEILKNYYPFLLICIGYSFVKMMIDSDGDLSKFYKPFQEFLINIGVIGLFGLMFSGILGIFLKSKEFHKKLIWGTSIVSLLGLIGMNLN